MKYVFVFERDVKIPVAVIGRAVAEASGTALADATRMLRRARGLFEVDLPRNAKITLAEEVTELGHPVRALPADLIPSMPPPLAILDADPGPDGLTIQRAVEGVPDWLPWSRVLMLVAGRVEIERARARAILESLDSNFDPIARQIMGPLSSRPGAIRIPRPAPPRRKPIRDTLHCFDLLARGPEARYRVAANRFIYDYLGDEIGLASTVNFRTLIEDIAEHAPDTLLATSTTDYLTNARPGTHRFDSPEAFDGYTKWLRVWLDVWG